VTDRWVINASPLILLGKAGQLDWVAKLGQVVVPQSVAHEICAGPTDDEASRWLALAVGKELIVPDATAPPSLAAWDLGAGETSVLAWAIEHRGYEAVLDDAAARRCALVYRIAVRGTLGLVALAKRRGFISQCRPVFARLLSSGLFINPDLLEQVALAAGE
jgi:predicted nucleic acid-binding protein